MDMKVQSRLLKCIEYGEFKRVGGNKVRRVDVRFIVGTDIDLKRRLKRKIQEDLYHELTAFPIEVPALRDRKEDVPLLANYFLTKAVKLLQKLSYFRRGYEVLNGIFLSRKYHGI